MKDDLEDLGFTLLIAAWLVSPLVFILYAVIRLLC